MPRPPFGDHKQGVAFWRALRKKILSALLGVFMLLGGVNQFRKPCITLFVRQILLSKLPFPVLSKWAGELGEIFAGLALPALLVFWVPLPPGLAGHVFHLANALIVFIVCAAVYVHLHPDVPAKLRPFGFKPPLSTVLTLSLAVLNIWLHQRA